MGRRAGWEALMLACFGAGTSGRNCRLLLSENEEYAQADETKNCEAADNAAYDGTDGRT